MFSFQKWKGESNWWQHGPFTLYWPHLYKPPPPPNLHTQLSLSVSHILFKSCWVKALSLPSFNKMPVHSSWGFHVSPNRERLGQKKSPPERNPICVLIHSAGLDMSKQLAFTTLATLFTSHWQTIWVYTHTQTHWIRVLDGRPNTHELREINVLVVAQKTILPGSLWHWVAKPSEKPEDTDGRKPRFLNGGEIYGPWYFEKHCLNGKPSTMAQWGYIWCLHMVIIVQT